MNTPCNFDHNGECLVCDCWFNNCAWDRLIKENFTWENRDELLKMFRDFIRENNLEKVLKEK